MYVSMLLLWASAVLAAADPLCDPVTQYLSNGECCQKCEPGTSMVSRDCRNPVCKGCDKNEYMDRYNTEQMCERQPSCDLNSNFKWPESTSTTQQHQCLCKEGFHCSSVSCLTCVPHRECEPGSGASVIGGQTQDTVCEPCPDGTFSDEKSWNGTCKKRTQCTFGITPKDHENECERWHVIAIAVVTVLAVGVAIAVALFFVKRKGKTGHELSNTPDDPKTGTYKNGDLHIVDIEEKEEEHRLITNPTEDGNSIGSPYQETHYPSGCPEETEDVVFTANGNVLSQDGKEYVVSQPETQAIAVK